jgi:hypothetical protein
VTVDEFIEIMSHALKDSAVSDSEDFIQHLVDLFYRSKKTTSKTLKFENLTAHLIEHEIAQGFNSPSTASNLQYVEASVKDRKVHN